MPFPNQKNGGNRVFGQVMSKNNGNSSNKKTSRYRRQFGGSRHPEDNQRESETEARAAEAAARKRARQLQGEAIDLKFGYPRLEDQHFEAGAEPAPRRGWIFQMLPTTVSRNIFISLVRNFLWNSQWTPF